MDSSKEKIEIGKFWGSQPHNDSDNCLNNLKESVSVGEIKNFKDIQQTPYNLPVNFEWVSYDIDDPTQLDEIYALLKNNYVENDDFRFHYSKEFLLWALKPPGYLQDWHLGVKMLGELIGFISAIPVIISVNNNIIKMVEINFLCVRKDIHNHRLTPVLIMEITRRANLIGIFQAVYTAGVTLPTPVAYCQYYHRMLNPKKLIETNFFKMKNRMTMARTIKLYQLPTQTLTPGLRSLKDSDCASACRLLQNYLSKLDLHMEFTIEEFRYWFYSKIVYCYVVEDSSNNITDLCSFYSLPSTILNNSKYSTLNAAYSWYNVATSVSLTQLMKDAIILANNTGFDVFNCLDVQNNKIFLNDLKFEPGNGYLKYYLYNRKTPQINLDNIGIVLF